MNWDSAGKKEKPLQRTLFLNLEGDERKVFDVLSEKGPQAIDMLSVDAAMSPGTLASVLLSLELKGVVTAQPGRVYSLI
jgi:DNA processing protein